MRPVSWTPIHIRRKDGDKATFDIRGKGVRISGRKSRKTAATNAVKPQVLLQTQRSPRSVTSPSTSRTTPAQNELCPPPKWEDRIPSFEFIIDEQERNEYEIFLGNPKPQPQVVAHPPSDDEDNKTLPTANSDDLDSTNPLSASSELEASNASWVTPVTRQVHFDISLNTVVYDVASVEERKEQMFFTSEERRRLKDNWYADVSRAREAAMHAPISSPLWTAEFRGLEHWASAFHWHRWKRRRSFVLRVTLGEQSEQRQIQRQRQLRAQVFNDQQKIDSSSATPNATFTFDSKSMATFFSGIDSQSPTKDDAIERIADASKMWSRRDIERAEELGERDVNAASVKFLPGSDVYSWKNSEQSEADDCLCQMSSCFG